MPRSADTETRTVPVAVLKAYAGLLLLLWLTLFAVFILFDWHFDGPPSQRVAHGLLFAANLMLGVIAAQLWRAAIGMTPATRASDVRYLVGEMALLIPAMTVRTHHGDREVRIAQPEGVHDRWATRWSIGAPQGTVERVSYGPDPMRSLSAALADAEAAVAVPGGGG